MFDSLNPFPDVRHLDVTYDDEKKHAATVDDWLGFRSGLVEDNLRLEDSAFPSREFWIGKSIQTFSTPYTELRAVLEDLRPHPSSVLIDLGAGYGRMAHVMAKHQPTMKFVGYEFVEPRQKEGQRLIELHRLANAELLHQDVTTLDFGASLASYFFIYDFGSREDVEITVENLKKAAAVRSIAVVARGGRSRDVIEKHHPWLSRVVTPLHRPHYSIYRSAGWCGE